MKVKNVKVGCSRSVNKIKKVTRHNKTTDTFKSDSDNFASTHSVEYTIDICEKDNAEEVVRAFGNRAREEVEDKIRRDEVEFMRKLDPKLR